MPKRILLDDTYLLSVDLIEKLPVQGYTFQYVNDMALVSNPKTRFLLHDCVKDAILRSPAQWKPTNHERIPRQTSLFSTTASVGKRGERIEQDKRIKYIRYTLYHPKVPRPLRFSRNRFLRHWTIHRAWQLHRRNERAAQQQDLENLYNSMKDACEHLRIIGSDGLEGGKDQGRLFRKAMMKEHVWQGFPIEHSRAQTEYPAKGGWNYAWKRRG